MIPDHGREPRAAAPVPRGGPRRRRPLVDRAGVLAALRMGRLPVGAPPAGPVGGGLVPGEGPSPAGGCRGHRAGGGGGGVGGTQGWGGGGGEMGEWGSP